MVCRPLHAETDIRESSHISRTLTVIGKWVVGRTPGQVETSLVRAVVYRAVK
jgi:hypothetical protein